MASPNGYQNGNTADLKAATKQKASGVYNYAQRSVDRLMPASSRERAYNNASEFATAKPILSSFIVCQLILSFLPLLLFISFALSTIAFALGGAIVFAVFWIGVAFMVLIPTLILTSFVAALVWGWAFGSFLTARWLYVYSPVGVKGEIKAGGMGKSIVVVKDDHGIDGAIMDENH